MKLIIKKQVRIVKRKQNRLSSALIAKQFNISKRRVEQVWSYFCKNTAYLPIQKPGRKPYRKEIPNLKDRILRIHKKHNFGATYIAKFLRDKLKIPISNNYIHQILLDGGLAMPNKCKQKRRKPWVRYERRHSLSAVHMDWHYSSKLNKWMCAVLDDASRKIISGGEYDNAYASHCIDMLEKAYEKNKQIIGIREVITDHGSQFFANKKKNDGDQSESKFQEYCKNKGINHIFCKYHHPQTNGKFEKWNHTYELHRYRFNFFEEFVDWYNNRPHGSLNFMTPEQAFWFKAQDIILGWFFKWAELN